MPLCYVGNESYINAALGRVNQNCGFPNGSTETWDIPQKAYQQDFYFFTRPPENGYTDSSGSWTQAQMIAGVENVGVEEFQKNWDPPTPFPPVGN